MAIVSKTNPKGVDYVLDAIQQYLYPNLLGIGWTDYEMYPRANKNAKGQNVIAEVSTDPKDYKEVLFSDKFNATSFFLVSDEVEINNEERLIVQDVSIIFQLNLDKLYPGITTHRADEEAHANITQIFAANDDLFVETSGYITTVEKVYSELSIGNFSRNNLPLDDLSHFHVVRYDFKVTYGLDDCQTVFSPTCDPASISINGDSFAIVASGAALDVTIQNTLGNDPIVSIIGTVVTVAAGGTTPLNTANLFKTGQTSVVRTGGDGDLQEGRGSDWWTCGYTNPFYGGNARFRGNTGGYTDGTNYFDVNDNATTKTLAFPNDEMMDWAYYNQVNGTVPMWYINPFGDNVPTAPQTGTIGGQDWEDAIDGALASTQNSYTDWYLPNAMEVVSLINWEQNINDDQGLNWKPLDYNFTGSPTKSNWRIWTSTANGSRAVYWILDNGILATTSPTTSSYTYFIKRNATLANLGL